MQKVDGSSPFIRLGVEPNQPLSAFGRAPQMPQTDGILERLGAVTKRIESLWTIRRDRFESVDATARQIRERDVGVIHVQGAAADGSSSASAARVSGTSRRLLLVFVPLTNATRRVLSTSRRSSADHSAGRMPVAVANSTAAASSGLSSSVIARSSSGVYTRMSRGEGIGFGPASLAGLRCMKPYQGWCGRVRGERGGGPQGVGDAPSDLSK